MSATSGKRPWPPEARGEVPVPRLQHRGPAGAQVATCSLTAGCSHMPPSMAGAKSTGPRTASRSVPRKSSASPSAARASACAVAGATTVQIGALGERDVLHGRGLLRVEQVGQDGPAGQRPERERGDELLACAVITTVTAASARRSSRRR